MGELKRTVGVCPNCGKTISGFQSSGRFYGSPIRNCTKCKGEYLDTRYHELAIEGDSMAKSELSIKSDLTAIGIMVGVAVVCGAINLADIYFFGKYFVMLAVVTFLAIPVVIYEIVDIIRIATGSKERSFQKKRMASIARLMDPDYAHRLAEAGYPVPDKYLQTDALGE